MTTQPQVRDDPAERGLSQTDPAAALAELSDRAGYIPRVQLPEEPVKTGFRGGRALFAFFLCNAVPIGSFLYYMRKQREERAQMSLLSLPVDADDVAAEALRAIRTAGICFLLQPGGANGDHSEAIHVDPHLPEGTAYVPPMEPLALVPQLPRSDITDIFESPPVAGLGFIHFALARSSAPGDALLTGHRQASLLYTSSVRGAYCTVTGQVSILTDPESRRRYWKRMWGASFPMEEVKAPAPGDGEGPPPWMHGDYLLVRLAVDDVTLQALVDGPQRWVRRRVRLLDRLSREGEGPNWTFEVPGGAGGTTRYT